MRTFLIRLVLFLLVSIVGYVILVIAWGEIAPTDKLQDNLGYKINGYGHLNTRLKEVKEYKNIDILFLGSSRAYRHYDPRIFEKKGYTSFNLGSSSQTFIQTEVLLKRYLSDLNPKIIVLDIYPGMFSSDGVESSLDVLSNGIVDTPSLQMVLLQKNIKVFNTLILSWYKSLFFNKNNEIEKRIKGKDTYVNGGYVEKSLSRARIDSSDVMDFTIKNYQLDAFSNVISQIRKNNIKLIVVQSPRHKSKYYNKESRLDSIMDSHNLKYFNYGKLSILNDKEHFYNPMHLNQEGVVLYNNYIIENIIRYLNAN